jgi:TRAP-type C4-dicarboxylate transport system substrate-binding protein
VPVPIEMVDLYESLSRGAVNGTYAPLETLKGFKPGEVEKFVTASWKMGSVVSFYVAMNKSKWNNLQEHVAKARKKSI